MINVSKVLCILERQNKNKNIDKLQQKATNHQLENIPHIKQSSYARYS